MGVSELNTFTYIKLLFVFTVMAIVLPIKQQTYHTDKNEFNRFATVGLSTLELFLDPSFHLIIIVPKIQLTEARTKIISTKLRIQFVEEEELLDDQFQNIRGWSKQMLLKLLIATIIKEPYYMVIDADLILTKPLTHNDLFYENRLIGCKEKWHTTDSPDYAVSTHWWQNSHRFLQPFMIDFDSNYMMSVTPETFIVKEVLDLMSKLSGRHTEWQAAFFKHGATEFCTYWLHLMEEGKTHLYNFSETSPSLWTMDRSRNWLYNHSNQSLEETIKAGFERNQNDFFIVVQSHTNVCVKQLSKLVKNQLETIKHCTI
jgi:hypothetical protein